MHTFLSRFLFVLLCCMVVACTRTPSPAVQVPTLAVLPSETAIPAEQVMPTVIFTPSLEPSPTLSPIPTIAPSLTPTPLPPCDVAAWLKQVDPLLVQFLDVVDVAASTARASLSGVLLQMQVAFRSLQRVEHPECANEGYNELVAGMEYTIQGYKDFLGELEFSSGNDLEVATAHFWAAALIFGRYNTPYDNRMLNVSNGISGILMNAETATWVGQVGINGVSDKAATQMLHDFATQSADYDMTMTALMNPQRSAAVAPTAIPTAIGGGYNCADGTISHAPSPIGACSHHGGIR